MWVKQYKIMEISLVPTLYKNRYFCSRFRATIATESRINLEPHLYPDALLLDHTHKKS